MFLPLDHLSMGGSTIVQPDNAVLEPLVRLGEFCALDL
jgi:hypothetical protein